MTTSHYSFSQSAPVLAAESGEVAVLGCSNIIVMNSSIPNSNSIEWWYDADNNPATPDVQVQIGGTSLLPSQQGFYYVKFPWHTDNSNSIESVSFTPLTLNSEYLSPNNKLTPSLINPSPGRPWVQAPYCKIEPNYTPGVEYSQHLWTRDQDIYSSAIVLEKVRRSGDYALTVNGPCGVESPTENVPYECDNAILSSSVYGYNTTFINGGSINTSLASDCIFGGTVTIVGSIVLNAHYKMEQDAMIYVPSGSTLSLDGSIFNSCGTWKGIVVDGGQLNFTGAPPVQLAHIYDAEVAITVLNSPSNFIVRNAVFEGNGVHIASSNSNYGIEKCTFNSLAAIPNQNPYASFLTNKQTDNPMIYAEYTSLSAIIDCTFDQRDDNTFGSPNTTTAIELNNTTLNANGYIHVYDNFLYGIHATNSPGVYIKALRFGSPFISSLVDYHYNQPFSNHGVYLKNCKSALIGKATLRPSETGIQWYLNEDLNPQQFATNFNEIDIYHVGVGNDRAGIIIAPDVNPLTNSNPGLNASTTPLKVDISCSKIENCDYGIIGSGKKTDWVMKQQWLTGNYGEYDPSIEFVNNVHWNILWSENLNWDNTPHTGIPPMKYYYSNTYATPLYSANSANSTRHTPLLDGTLIYYNNTGNRKSPFEDILSMNGPFCTPSNRVFYKKDVASAPTKVPEDKKQLYPNPFTHSLYIDLGEDEKAEVVVYNTLGKKITENLNATGLVYFNTQNWTSGIYFVTLTSTRGSSSYKVIKQ